MSNYLAKWKDNFSSVQQNEEGADIVQTILIIVLFVVGAVVIIGLVYNAIKGQADRVSECLADSSPVTNNGQQC